MGESGTPLTAAGNLSRPSIPVVIGWVKTVWECIPVEMVCRSYWKYGISNKMDETKDDALYEGFLGKESVAETGDMADDDGYANYYDDSPATHKYASIYGTVYTCV